MSGRPIKRTLRATPRRGVTFVESSGCPLPRAHTKARQPRPLLAVCGNKLNILLETLMIAADDL